MQRRKNTLNILDLVAVVRELNYLVGSILDKAYLMGDSLILRFRHGAEKQFLIANAHRFGLTSYVSELGGEGLLGLRRLLENSRLRGLGLMNMDRIVKLDLGDGSLIIELLEPWNAIYVDSEGTVRWALRNYRGKDRTVTPGLKYVPPPQVFVRITENNDSVMNSLLRYDSLMRALSRGLGLGPEVAQEVCARASLDCASGVSENALVKALNTARSVFNEVSQGPLEPTIYYVGGEPITVTPIRYVSISTGEAKSYPTFNTAVDEYFHMIELNESLMKKLESVNSEIARLERSSEELMVKAEEFRRGARELRLKAETVLNWKYVIEELMNTLRNYWYSYKDEFSELIRNMEYQGIRVVGFEPSRKLVTLDINGIVVSIPLNGDVGDLINDLFSRARELERKAQGAEDALSQLRARIEELSRARDEYSRELRVRVTKVVYGAREWFERFRWFITSGGKLVIAGRDATQNEVLVKRYMRPWDIFMHADIPGGSVVILRLGRGEDPSEEELREAAQYAVSHSRAWVMGVMALDAFYVRGEQVTKEAPSGEYLGKGSFMIYGSRGWVRGVELRLGVGVRLDEVDDTVLVRVVTAPPSAIARLANYYAIIRPGGTDRARLGRELYEGFVNKDPRVGRALRIDNIVEALPGPSVVEGVYEGRPMTWSEVKGLVGE
ncbi:ribosome rescue protein RqcH [Vulcanisaeta thermophila]|uniref:ribosome rescue protein RqcH n=1 Tax=Vulcanisaeta thermophila TaxID=867917 RepID=UPI0008533664|nr:ribosome rescue protein RqcH [Vulcanisaeta thermophila]